MKFIKIIPASFYQDESGNEPVRKRLRELSVKDQINVRGNYEK